ncbi:hypothetical protein L226DRAFT_520574 [Lentinus tigrinus ALCF2SS1-7]|uniref:uncharacterized protein n=1 Tax=Lentinus tigrinus ALCF2SS1-7 TaxID=1328758 RepID=UPI001165F988|nr:hypothetical protein L226DRAFT_520574 [Lentinus tigrinus ALCF2SS1-7]
MLPEYFVGQHGQLCCHGDPDPDDNDNVIAADITQPPAPPSVADVNTIIVISNYESESQEVRESDEHPANTTPGVLVSNACENLCVVEVLIQYYTEPAPQRHQGKCETYKGRGIENDGSGMKQGMKMWDVFSLSFQVGFQQELVRNTIMGQARAKHLTWWEVGQFWQGRLMKSGCV